MSYYQRNRAIIIARQTEYHQKNRERYLAYMKEYNKKYYLAHRPPPKPKKEKPPKVPRVPKPKKEPKEKKVKKDLWFVPPQNGGIVVERGQFVLDFP
jgi:hypothetical protein